MSSSAAARTSKILTAIDPQNIDLKHFTATHANKEIANSLTTYLYRQGTELEAEVHLDRHPQTPSDYYQLALSFFQEQRSLFEMPTFKNSHLSIHDFYLHLILDAAEAQYKEAKQLLGQISHQGAHGLDIEDLTFTLVERGYREYSLDVLLDSLKSGNTKAKIVLAEILQKNDSCGLTFDDLASLLPKRGFFLVKNRKKQQEQYFWIKGSAPKTIPELKACIQTLREKGGISPDLILNDPSQVNELIKTFVETIESIKTSLHQQIHQHFNQLIAYAKAGNQEQVAIDSEAIMKSVKEAELPSEEIKRVVDKLGELTRFKVPSPVTTPRDNFFAHSKILRPATSRGISPTSTVAADLNLADQENMAPNNEMEMGQQLRVF